jgi:transcription elongation factor GreA
MFRSGLFTSFFTLLRYGGGQGASFGADPFFVFAPGEIIVNFAEPMQLTAEGWRNLQAELAELETKRSAFPIGGFEYSEEGDHLDPDREALTRRIDELRNLLSFSVPVDDKDRIPGVVGVGSQVTVRWEMDGDETYTIVGSAEIDRKLGHISYESPIGQLLLGKRAGDALTLVIPDDVLKLQIIEVA